MEQTMRHTPVLKLFVLMCIYLNSINFSYAGMSWAHDKAPSSDSSSSSHKQGSDKEPTKDTKLPKANKLNPNSYIGAWGSKNDQETIIFKQEGPVLKVTGSNLSGHWELFCKPFQQVGELKCMGYSVTNGDSMSFISSEFMLQKSGKLEESWRLHDEDKIRQEIFSQEKSQTYEKIGPVESKAMPSGSDSVSPKSPDDPYSQIR
jgi:hypothetical protein